MFSYIFLIYGQQITGVTGYIGFKTLTIALERGYRVRAVVRSERNINELKDKSTIIAQSLDQEQLEFVVIPHFLEPDAIFKSLEGITAIIHLASPLALEVMHTQRTRCFSRLTCLSADR